MKKAAMGTLAPLNSARAQKQIGDDPEKKDNPTTHSCSEIRGAATAAPVLKDSFEARPGPPSLQPTSSSHEPSTGGLTLPSPNQAGVRLRPGTGSRRNNSAPGSRIKADKKPTTNEADAANTTPGQKPIETMLRPDTPPLRTHDILLELSQQETPKGKARVFSELKAELQSAQDRLEAKRRAAAGSDKALYQAQLTKLEALEANILLIATKLKQPTAPTLKSVEDVVAFIEESASKELKHFAHRWRVKANMAIKRNGIEFTADTLFETPRFERELDRLQRAVPGIQTESIKAFIKGTLLGQKVRHVFDEVKRDCTGFNIKNRWTIAKEKLNRINAFATIDESMLKAQFINEGVEDNLKRAKEARFEQGFWANPACFHADEIPIAKSSFRQAKEKYGEAIKSLELLNGMLGSIGPKQREAPTLDVAQLENRLREVYVSGLLAWEEHRKELQSESLRAHTNRMTAQKAMDCLEQALKSGAHAAEVIDYWVFGNLSRLGGVKNAGNYVDSRRQWYENNLPGGSVLGDNEEFSEMNLNFRRSFFELNPLAHVADASANTTCELADLTYDEYQKHTIEWGTGQKLTESQFRRIQAQSSLLRAGKTSFDTAKAAASVAVAGKLGQMPPKQMAKMVGIKTGLGLIGTASDEDLYREGGAMPLVLLNGSWPEHPTVYWLELV